MRALVQVPVNGLGTAYDCVELRTLTMITTLSEPSTFFMQSTLVEFTKFEIAPLRAAADSLWKASMSLYA